MDIRLSDLREKTLFRTRSGSPARITAVHPDDIYPFTVKSFDGINAWTVREDGFSLDSLEPSRWDLVDHWGSNLVLSQADVGKHFKNREGDVVKIVACNSSSNWFPVRCRRLNDEFSYYVTTAGRHYYYGESSDHRFDLIEEVHEPLLITEADIGKKFRARDGRTVTITRVRTGGIWPVRGEDELGNQGSFSYSGYWNDNLNPCELDLVERLPEPEPEPITITKGDIGKKFLTRDGRTVTITRILTQVDDDPWPAWGCVEGSDFEHSFATCGSWISQSEPKGLDLIERLPDPEPASPPPPEGDEEDALFMTLLGLAFLASLSDSGHAPSTRT